MYAAQMRRRGGAARPQAGRLGERRGRPRRVPSPARRPGADRPETPQQTARTRASQSRTGQPEASRPAPSTPERPAGSGQKGESRKKPRQRPRYGHGKASRSRPGVKNKKRTNTRQVADLTAKR